MATTSRHRMLRKIGICFCAIILAFTLLGCMTLRGHQQPYCYPSTEWICEDPKIHILVDQTGGCSCLILENCDYSSVEVDFDFSDRILFSGEDGKNLLVGNCRFSSGSFTALIEKDELFDGKYLRKKITFVRQGQ